VFRRILLLLTAVPAALLIMATGAPTASAHAVLVGSTPLDGSRLDTVPERVALRFDEPVRIVTGGTNVLSTAGGRVDTGKPSSADGGRSVIIPLSSAGTRAATYLVSYRIVSADGHVVVGSIRFGVGEDPEAVAQPNQAGAGPPGVIAAIGTGLTYAGVIGAIGCLAVGLLVWPSVLRSDRLRPVIIGGPLMIMVGTIAELLAAAPAAEGTGLRGMLQPQNLPFTLIGQQGRLLAARFTLAAGLLPLGAAVRPTRGQPSGDRILQGAWWVASTALLITVAASGHGFAGAQRWLALPATAIHLAAMAFWIGGVIDLLLVVRPRLRGLPNAAGMIIDAWSRRAFLAVAALVLSGEILAWRQVQPIEALWSTPYGITLLIKLGLAAIAVIIGWTGSRVAARRRDASGTTRSMIIEVVIMTLVVAAATVLSATPPAKDQYGPPAALSARFAGDRLQVRIVDTRRGPQQITVTAVDGSGRRVPIRGLTGRLSSADARVSAVDVRFTVANGVWRSVDATAPLPGLWRLQLTVTPGARSGSGAAYVTEVDYRVW
jgi:copper transport protein